MTGLLVSVRNAAEAALAVAAGVNVIDVKEPRHGSLGAAGADVIAEVVRVVDGRRPVSAALGELVQTSVDSAAALPAELAFAKLGLSQCATRPGWKVQWRAFFDLVGKGVSPVAVAYADGELCGAPAADEVLHAAVEMRCAAILVDTYDKTAGRLLDWWSLDRIARFIAAAGIVKLPVVLAGSLRQEDFALLLPLEPYLLAVRGAACRGGREGPLDPHALQNLVRMVAGQGCVDGVTASNSPWRQEKRVGS